MARKINSQPAMLFGAVKLC